ncbi:MAG: hypothetical protein HUU20_19445, partial [Pirellulales bacterium]|nr:hypothetical protein [Pirellulales bacterium]
MKLRSAFTLTVLLALASGALAVGPGEQPGQMSITGTIVKIHPKGNLITVEPMSGAQLQTQQAVIKPGKKNGPVTIAVDGQTVILGGGKGKPMPGKLGKQPPLGKGKPIPGQSKALMAESVAVEDAAPQEAAAPVEMAAPAEPGAPAEAVAAANPAGPVEPIGPLAPTESAQPATLAPEAAALVGPPPTSPAPEGAVVPAGPTAGPGQSIGPPTDQRQGGKPQQQPPVGKPGKPIGKQKPEQGPGKPMGKIRPWLEGLQVGQLVQVIYTGMPAPIGPGQAVPGQFTPVQGKPGQAVPGQFTPVQGKPGPVVPGQVPPVQGKPEQASPGQFTPQQQPPGKAKPPLPEQVAPKSTKAAIGAERGVTVEMVEPMESPATPFRAISIRILSTMDRPMPAPAFGPPTEPEPAAPAEPE